MLQAYASVPEYKGYSRESTGTTDSRDDIVLGWQLDAVSRYIDARLGQYFGKSDVPSVREFRSLHAQPLLRVDNFASPIVVVTPEGLEPLPPTDYRLVPLNAVAKDEPYNGIELRAMVWRAGAHVFVEAEWGWPAVPSAIKIGTIELVKVVRLEGGRSTSNITDMGVVIGASKEAKTIIDRLLDTYAPGIVVA